MDSDGEQRDVASASGHYGAEKVDSGTVLDGFDYGSRQFGRESNTAVGDGVGEDAEGRLLEPEGKSNRWDVGTHGNENIISADEVSEMLAFARGSRGTADDRANNFGKADGERSLSQTRRC